MVGGIVGVVEGKGVGLPAENVGFSDGMNVGLALGLQVGALVDFPGK